MPALLDGIDICYINAAKRVEGQHGIDHVQRRARGAKRGLHRRVVLAFAAARVYDLALHQIYDGYDVHGFQLLSSMS